MTLRHLQHSTDIWTTFSGTWNLSQTLLRNSSQKIFKRSMPAAPEISFRDRGQSVWRLFSAFGSRAQIPLSISSPGWLQIRGLCVLFSFCIPGVSTTGQESSPATGVGDTNALAPYQFVTTNA